MQVSLLQQQKVPALGDASASFVVDPKDKFTLLTKPHGHGDVHALLHSSGTAARWLREGRRWLMFLQDSSTNYLATFLAALGVSAVKGCANTTGGHIFAMARSCLAQALSRARRAPRPHASHVEATAVGRC
eukprot:scaffold140698_cov33-Tisochrysis_lutea.AAC.4